MVPIISMAAMVPAGRRSRWERSRRGAARNSMRAPRGRCRAIGGRSRGSPLLHALRPSASRGGDGVPPPDLIAMQEAITPLGRMATPEEAAAAAVWLCSDAASYITGIALSVDGARRA